MNQVTISRPVKVHDGRLSYPGYFSREYDAFCRLRIYHEHATGMYILLATVDNANEGLSVTNRIERIATIACLRFKITAHRVIAITHHPAEGEYLRWRDPAFSERFARAHLEVGESRLPNIALLFRGTPEWSHLERCEVCALVGVEV